MKSVFFATLTLLLSISACRYKDGPSISILSAQTRITHVWVVQKYSDNGNDQTNNFNLLFPEYTLDMKNDMNYTLVSKGIVPFNESGKWEFRNGKESFNLKKGGTGTNVWHITRLKNNELWANQVDKDGHLLEFQLKVK